MPPNDPQPGDVWERQTWRTFALKLICKCGPDLFQAREIGPWRIFHLTREELIREYTFVRSSQ